MDDESSLAMAGRPVDSVKHRIELVQDQFVCKLFLLDRLPESPVNDDTERRRRQRTILGLEVGQDSIRVRQDSSSN
jgi:hypothetical protein